MHPYDPRPMQPRDLPQRWPLPARPRPVCLIGAGGIVRDAHLPAYRKAGIPVAGVYDPDQARAHSLARDFGIDRVHSSLEQAVAEPGQVLDLALPPRVVGEVLGQLPTGSIALVQKPLGLDLAEATEILRRARARRIVAAMNFQLRFSPQMLVLRRMVREGMLGELVELDIRINCRMPWHRWPFLASLPRLEFLMHSIHYLDLLRSIAGEPRAAWGRCVRHPDGGGMAATRSSAILDFGPSVRCTLSINHHHAHGPRHEASELRVEGTRGAAVAVMGANLDYPVGRPDRLEVSLGTDGWHEVPLEGNWFPDAFIGPMANLQRFACGEDPALESPLEDAWKTMRVVEALYRSDATGGTPLAEVGEQPA